MIDKNSPLPIYYQLEEEIRLLIQTEKLSPGELLPSEREYAERYNISRMTVRQAINNLAAEGLLYRQKGRGTFVSEKKFEQDLQGLTSFSEDMRARGLTPSNKLLSFQTLHANERIAELLRLNKNDEVYEIKRIRYANESPVAVETIYTPKHLVGNLTDANVVESFYKYIETNLNLNISYGDQMIESVLANEFEIENLHVKAGDPVLLIQRITYLSDENATPLEYVKSAYRADKYKFKLQMRR
ncbi:phosphonate metabolism transcriptional regulator PhnF [Virgibacillus phasianinus]|uniref:Phosphonate metabolism transcriptional regulator PhnF n=1 Tax=Virgibacillus phasianinus TaxID=2017483 RepID=A0A220U3S6_9BACI|nr:GntR family transcriptional regulator [Virgibacillus phasianinus]ASK62715.1 phosphonate metabolism transcriptional regulator PhnF [Virgibacillus phasianinus]